MQFFRQIIRQFRLRFAFQTLLLGLFALVWLYLNLPGEMPDDFWLFDVEPAGRLESVDRFLSDNPQNRMLKIKHNLPVWIIPRGRPVEFSFVAHITPPGHLLLLLRTGLEQDWTALRLGTSKVFEDEVLYYKNGQVTREVPLDFSSRQESALDKFVGSLPDWALDFLVNYVPGLLPRVTGEVRIDQGGITFFVGDQFVKKLPLGDQPQSVGLWALGSDFPVFIKSLTATYDVSNGGQRANYRTTFGPDISFSQWLGFWLLFALCFYLLSLLAAAVLAGSLTQVTLRGFQSAGKLFRPVLILPLFPGPLAFVAISLILLLFIHRLLHEKGISLPTKFFEKLIYPLAFLPIALQSLLFFTDGKPAIEGLVGNLVTLAAWALPALILSILSGFSFPQLKRVYATALALAVILQIVVLISCDENKAILSAVNVFGIILFSSSIAVFKSRRAKRPNTVLFLFALLFFALLEITLRSTLGAELPAERLPGRFETDQTLFWRLKTTEAPFSNDKALDEKRIICLGGSVTQGAGLADSGLAYPGVLSDLLNRDDKSNRWVVMNAGVSGYCSVQGKKQLEGLMHYSPDVVTVCYGVNEYNGFGMNVSMVEYVDRMQGKQSPRATASTFLRKSLLYRGLLDLASPRDVGPGGRREQAFFYTPNSRPQEFARMLREINDMCIAAGAKMVLLKEVHLRQLFGPHEVDQYGKVQMQIAQERSLPVVDLLEFLKAHPADFMLLDDVHPSPQFHRQIARQLEKTILNLESSGAQ